MICDGKREIADCLETASPSHQCTMKHPERPDETVEPVSGPVAKLEEWGRNHGHVAGDGCPSPMNARYTLFVKGQYIAQCNGNIASARMFREIALALNGERCGAVHPGYPEVTCEKVKDHTTYGHWADSHEVLYGRTWQP